MGCCSSKEETPGKKIETLLREVEASLKLSNKSANYFGTLIQKQCSGVQMSETQLDVVIKSLKIEKNLSVVKGFFIEFFDGDKLIYSVKPLITLGILLGIGSKQEKIKALFGNYSKNGQSFLTPGQIEAMLSDITLICFQYLTTFASRVLTGNNKDLVQRYKFDLIGNRNTIVKYYKTLMFEENKVQNVPFDRFSRFFDDSKVSSLLSTSSARIQSIEFVRMLEKATSAARLMTDEGHKSDTKSVYEDLLESEERHKRSR